MTDTEAYAAPGLSYRGMKAAQCALAYPEPKAPAKAPAKKAKKAKAKTSVPEVEATPEVEALPETGLEEENGDTTEA